MNLALFDLDNTLLHGDSDHAWGEFLCARGAVDAAAYEAKNNEFYAPYQAGTLDNAAFLDFVLAPLAQIPRDELDSIHADFMRDVIAKMILPAGRKLLQDHMANGDLIAIVTATNAFVTAPIVRELCVAHLIATIPAQENGAFTGTVRGTPAFQAGKITRVTQWLESQALSLNCFEKSYFYSDSRNDIPLLERVTHPVAVDADAALTAHARAEGWPIMSVRQ